MSCGEDKQAVDVALKPFPVLDRLQERLEAGAVIKEKDGLWCLFKEDGDLIAAGPTIRGMLVELIFVDC